MNMVLRIVQEHELKGGTSRKWAVKRPVVRAAVAMEPLGGLADGQQRIVESAPFVVRETYSDTGRPIKESLGLFFGSYIASSTWPERWLALLCARVT